MRVKFTANYDHTYPSGAMQFFPKSYEGIVRRIVGDAAIAAGKAEEVKPQPGDVDPDAATPIETVRDVQVHDIPPAATVPVTPVTAPAA